MNQSITFCQMINCLVRKTWPSIDWCCTFWQSIISKRSFCVIVLHRNPISWTVNMYTSISIHVREPQKKQQKGERERERWQMIQDRAVASRACVGNTNEKPYHTQHTHTYTHTHQCTHAQLPLWIQNHTLKYRHQVYTHLTSPKLIKLIYEHYQSCM